MAVSENKKASNARWDSANMSTLSCRISKSKAEAFRTLCAANGTTSYAVLLSVVQNAINSGKLPYARTGGLSQPEALGKLPIASGPFSP